MSKSDTPNIHRMPHDKKHPYVMINRDLAQNRSLSFAARGMLAYILSQANDWQINLEDLQQECGRDAARAILNELIKAGYIVPGTQKRVKGRFSTATPYQVYEQPITEKPHTVTPTTETPKTESQDTAKPSNIVNLDNTPRTEKPHTDQPRTVNPTEQSNKDNKVSKVQNKKDIAPSVAEGEKNSKKSKPDKHPKEFLDAMFDEIADAMGYDKQAVKSKAVSRVIGQTRKAFLSEGFCLGDAKEYINRLRTYYKNNQWTITDEIYKTDKNLARWAKSKIAETQPVPTITPGYERTKSWGT